MCTATWLRQRDGYELYFNRDERRTRSPALPPTAHASEGVSFVAPADGNFGGTWIAANRHGLSVCLLNYYQETVRDPPPTRTSRGLLVMSLAGVSTANEVRARLRASRLEDYNPFLLVVMPAARDPFRFTWDGRHGEENPLTDEDLPVTTSGFEPAAVCAARRKTYIARVGRSAESSEALAQYHRSQVHEDHAFDVCMSRPESATVSISHIRVTPDQVVFQYQEVDADKPAFAPPVEVAIPRHEAT